MKRRTFINSRISIFLSIMILTFSLSYITTVNMKPNKGSYSTLNNYDSGWKSAENLRKITIRFNGTDIDSINDYNIIWKMIEDNETTTIIKYEINNTRVNININCSFWRVNVKTDFKSNVSFTFEFRELKVITPMQVITSKTNPEPISDNLISIRNFMFGILFGFITEATFIIIFIRKDIFLKIKSGDG